MGKKRKYERGEEIRVRERREVTRVRGGGGEREEIAGEGGEAAATAARDIG